MLLIKNGYLLTMEEKDYENGCILIENGKIIEIGESIQETDEMEVIDAKGNLVMPGIIEAHCHIGITEEKKGMEGDDCNEITEPITPYLRAIDGINPMDQAFHDAIKAGITSVQAGPGSSNVVGGQFAFIKTHGRILSEMLVKEYSSMKVSFGENPKKNYGDKDKMPSTRMATAWMLRKELLNAKQYLEQKENAKKNNEPFAINYEIEPWIPVLLREVPLKAHVHRVDDIMTAIRIAKEFNLKMTLDHCSEGHLIKDSIKEAGYPVIIGPSLASRNKIEIQYASPKTAGVLQNEGILVGITTDHPVILIQYLPMCAGVAAKMGLGVIEALRAITINAAKICGVEERVGSLKVGKDADIVIFDDNPLEIFTNTLYTIINGIIVYDASKEEK
ncbi:dihydroorotase [Lachnospiraceae bacterium KM106-2]|nr:dihydroorotase [Lachnospiraceae bacterium KM106-2]